ncbi:MAG: formylglycine-generating enzyme family protein [Alphaproteobacteria bacterium]|nr:formylglycine-generating enzyme family protein [Alphaproteobacteria bacterium]MCZ6608099.1 formylglycine-generating enzyme family protein [Alphaproteobacteria bacterium]
MAPLTVPRLIILRVGIAIVSALAPLATGDAHKRGDTFKDCGPCPEMVIVPPGSFRMGDLYGIGYFSEKPIRTVRIDHAFAVGKFEVTFDEWATCVSGGGCNGYRPDDLGWGRGDRPVVHVSWHDAKTYVRWLSRKTGKTYRLLSEAEWEYAARAGTRTIFPWGNAVGSGYANCDGCGSAWDDHLTAPVGSFAPNGFGLHDMHGNVYEWVEDCWHSGYEGAPSDGSAWTSGGVCQVRILRGGSYDDTPALVRSANRDGNSASDRYNLFSGVRVARALSRR